MGLKGKEITSGRASLYVFLPALVLNILIACFLMTVFDINQRADYYHVIAQNLLEGNGYVIHPGEDPSIFRPPLYTIFLVLIYAVFGAFSLPVVVFQVVLNSLTSVLIYRLLKLLISGGVGFSAALCYALYPFTAIYLVRELPLIVFNFIFIFTVNLLYKAYKDPTKVNVFILGIMLGILTLCKFAMGLLPAFIILVVFLDSLLRRFRPSDKEASLSVPGRVIRRQIPQGLLMLFGFTLIMAPWLLGTFKATGKFPVLSSGGGFTLWIGNRTQTGGRDFDQMTPQELMSAKEEMRRVIGEGYATDLKNDRELYREAIKNFRNYPKESTILLCKKAIRLWGWVYTTDKQKYQKYITVFQVAIIVPAILGFFIAYKKGIRIAPLLLLIVYFQGVYTAYFGTIRYILPLMPLVIGFALFALWEGYKKIHLRRQS
ncbi:ArnT family glycosyltransferase [Acidobacteriota bacterium]